MSVTSTCIWCILYGTKVIKGNTIRVLPRSASVAFFLISSVSFERMGCEPVLNLAATPDKAVSKYVLLLTTLYHQLLGKLMYVSYTPDRSGASVGHRACDLALICLWVLWHGWLTLIGCLVKMALLLESSTNPMCIPIPYCWTADGPPALHYTIVDAIPSW